MREKSINPIFWQVKSKDIKPPDFIEFEGRHIEVIIEQCDYLESPSVFISDDLEQFKRADDKSARIFYYQGSLSLKQICNLVNEFRIQAFFRNDETLFKLTDFIKTLIKKQQSKLDRQSVMKLMQKKNNELEMLTHDLEKIVEERTFNIEESHKEEEQKLKKERQLIRFIKDLANQLSVEDILSYIRKDLRSFHFVSSPILVIQKNRNLQCYYFEKSYYNKFSRTVEPGFFINEKNLANIFGRPFLPIHQVVFFTQTKSEQINRVILCFELQHNGSGIHHFVEFLNERIDAIKAALDRIMLEKEKETYVQRWTNTFYFLQYPIAILDRNGEILRSNQKYGEITNEQDYQKMKFPFLDIDGEQVFLEIYIDRSNERQLYSRILQSEKLSAIGALAGNLAHELNNPLTGIRSLAQLLIVEPNLGDQLTQDLVEIEKAAERSQKIITNLIDFARGSRRDELVKVDDLIQKTLSLLKSALRHHRLTISLAANKSLINIEPQLFQQVIFNLVHNACQAMEDVGDVAIQSYVRKNQVLIEVIDSGPGISDQLKVKIFDPFFTTKSEGQGTGLGLFLVKQIIEKYKGHIEVKDQKPHGVRFVISFPKARLYE